MLNLLIKISTNMINSVSNINITTDKNNQQNFKGVGSCMAAGLRGLNNSPALGACAVDLCSMVTPRTIIETKNRGVQSGIETLFREGSSCLLHASLGLIGLGAANLISGKFNKKYNVKAQNIFASGQTINNMSSLWQKANGQTDKFFEEFLNNIQGLNGSEWKTVSSKAKDEIINNFVKLSEKTGELANAKGANKKNLAKEAKSLKKLISAQIIKDTGAQNSYKLNAVKNEAGEVIHKGVSSGLSDFIDNASSLANAFKSQPAEKFPAFIKSLTKNKTASTILGLLVCAALCTSFQPLNRYMTKKRTGEDGFVGVKNKEADKSKGFKTLKTALGVTFPVAAASTIGKPSELLSNIQFNGKIPLINHFKLIYGLTIGSRFMSARDKNELRESVIKDTLGYVNWLILGGMVSKLTARAIGGKELINNPIAQENGKKGIKYAAKWLTKTSVKSFDEVILPTSQEIIKDGKAQKFTELLKKADSSTKSKVMKIAGSQLAGYLYSGLVLGIGISKLNIFITKQVEAQREAKKQMNDEVSKDLKPCQINTINILKLKNQSSSVFKDFN